MEVEAIAVPRGAALLWIRVGSPLDARLTALPNQVVERIVSIPTGFMVETLDSDTGTTSYYEVANLIVCRVQPLSEEPTAVITASAMRHL